MSDAPAQRPKVGIVAEQQAIDRTFSKSSLDRLERVADVSYCVFDAPDIRYGRYADAAPFDPERDAALKAFVGDLDAIIVSKGSPRITADVMDAAPRLRFIGDLQGDRYARRIDVDAAGDRAIVAVDTTNGSSDPVAEWALALSLIGLRNAGALFRRYLDGELIFANRREFRSDPGYLRGELSGKTVGLVACGYIGRRLIELLKPFHVDVLVYDPYIPRVLADVYDMTITSLHNVMASSDVVVVLAPLTDGTRGLIGAKELAELRPGSVFVNVSRGPVVDSDALVARLRDGDVIACLDVFDPEPIPVDSPVRRMPNVFLSPHIAGVTAECGPRFFDLMVDEVLREFAGHETRHTLLPREELHVKYVTYESAGALRVGYLDGGQVVDAGFDGDMVAFIEAGAPAHDNGVVTGAVLRAPLRPRSLRDFLTFEGHMLNALSRLGRDIPAEWYDTPAYYKGLPDTVIGPDEEIPYPSYTDELDHELELAIVIGVSGRDIRKEDAGRHIFGYTLWNDLSARDTQRRELPVGMGPSKAKDWDGANVIGPCIATPDEFADVDDIGLRVRVNGEEWGSDTSGNMHHSFADLIAYASLDLTLRAGEVFGSGTAATGSGLELGRSLQPGDVVELEADRIGVLRNRVGQKSTRKE